MVKTNLRTRIPQIVYLAHFGYWKMPILFGFFDLGPTELMIIGAIAVLLYGKNLPEACRSVGKHLGAFRRGMSGIENEIRSTTSGLGLPAIPPLPRTRITSALSTLDSLTKMSSQPSTSATSQSRISVGHAVTEAFSDMEEPTAPKFEPPPA
jgi:TatA/E family protein of Tat protein translocase